MGIAFANPAVLAVSAPSLMMVPVREWWKKTGPPIKILWVQTMLLEAALIEKMPEDLGPIEKGPWEQTPADTGEWGHYMVGGELLSCPENERMYEDKGTCFCREPIEDIKQSTLKWQRPDGSWNSYVHGKLVTEWRTMCFDTLFKYVPDVLEFIQKLEEGRIEKMVRDRSLSRGQAVPALLVQPGEEEQKPKYYGEVAVKFPTGQELKQFQMEQWQVRETMAELQPLLDVMNRQIGVWQEPWPKLPEIVMLIMRDQLWWAMMRKWPRGRTLTGIENRKLARIGGLLKSLDHEVIHCNGVTLPEKWLGSADVERSTVYQDMKNAVKESQLYALENSLRDQKCLPMIQSELGATLESGIILWRT